MATEERFRFFWRRDRVVGNPCPGTNERSPKLNTEPSMNLFSRLFGRAPEVRTPARSAKLRIEALESREVPTGLASLNNGWITIVGYNYPNPNNTAVVSSTMLSGVPYYAVALDGSVSYFKASA